MELHQLQTFVIVAEEKSITRAAKRLFTTPSSISVQIKALEDELNVQLFVRKSHGMEITPKGAHLVTMARHTLQSARDMVNYAYENQAHLMGCVTVGLNGQPTFLRVPLWVESLGSDCPGIELRLMATSSAHILEGLLTEKYDVGYVYGGVNEARLAAHFVHKAELVVAAPSGWQNRLDAATWVTLAGLPWICSDGYCPFQNILDDLFQARGLGTGYEKIAQVDDETTKAELVASGLGLSLLERSEAEKLVKQAQVTIWATDPIYCDLSIVCLAHRQHDPLVHTVVDHINRTWK